jgi:hypothetical protein
MQTTTFNSEPQLNPRDSSVSSATDTTTTKPTQLVLNPAELRLIWASLDSTQKREFLMRSENFTAGAILDSLFWMWRATRTRDDQDQYRAYKPFPPKKYLNVLHNLWLREPFLFIEKSRTMMCSWWAAAETTHYIQTHQPAKAIYWAQDEDRSLGLLNYSWTLYEQQTAALRGLFPLDRARERQSYRQLEWKDGGQLLALPGKDPDKIRSEHPTIVVMDEACFIENGGEAFDVAISSKVPRVLVISSAAPSWFRRVTKVAVPEALNV